MNKKLSELLKVDFETRNGSTLATGNLTSKLYDMRDYDNALLTLSVGAHPATISTNASVVVDLVESSAVSVAGTTLIGGKAGIQIGSSIYTAIGASVGCAAVNIEVPSGSAATTGDFFRLGLGTNLVTFTFSSEASYVTPSTLHYSATQAYYGSSAADATADTGTQLLLDTIQTALKSTLLVIGGPNVFKFSTPSTEQLYVELVNSTLGNIVVSSTCASTRFRFYPSQINAAIPVRADQLTSSANKRFVGLKWTSLAQALPISVTCIRSKGRYMPSNFVGVLST